MTPSRVEDYVAELFHGSSVNVQVISDEETLLQEYPLFATVNRAASVIPRHRGRIIFLTYEPQNPGCVLETLLLVGKGVTYDTGGADIKIEGSMIGMSRDKCGAAACAGFMQVPLLIFLFVSFSSLYQRIFHFMTFFLSRSMEKSDGKKLKKKIKFDIGGKPPPTTNSQGRCGIVCCT